MLFFFKIFSVFLLKLKKFSQNYNKRKIVINLISRTENGNFLENIKKPIILIKKASK